MLLLGGFTPDICVVFVVVWLFCCVIAFVAVLWLFVALCCVVDCVWVDMLWMGCVCLLSGVFCVFVSLCVFPLLVCLGLLVFCGLWLSWWYCLPTLGVPCGCVVFCVFVLSCGVVSVMCWFVHLVNYVIRVVPDLVSPQLFGPVVGACFRWCVVVLFLVLLLCFVFFLP